MKTSACIAALLVLTASASVALADETTEAILKRLEALEKENSKLKTDLKRIEGKTASKPAAAKPVQETAAAMPVSPTPGAIVGATYIPTDGQGRISGPGYSTASRDEEGWFIRKKPGSKGLTFLTPGGQITLYGQLDVSVDYTTKGINGVVNLNGTDRPIGVTGWQPALSTNFAYVGVRGSQNLMDDLKFVYQLETQIDVTASAGIAESNSNQSNVVKGALTTRNSFIGFASDHWGAIKAGKTDAPYRVSTEVMNPFSGMLGDYRVIMGNSGGDNRVEFATRLDHALWYESPNLSGFSFAALYAPGQNRASNSDNIAAGESDCAGGNNPSSGGFTSCADGSFSDVVSVSATYKTPPGHDIGFLVTGAYERHQRVNRTSDFGVVSLPNDVDVADEDAAKVGVQLTLPTKTTISGIYERLHRYVPDTLTFQNERTRNGTWFAITQEITPKDNISFGWAHAFTTPGDPGQHNTTGGLNPQNAANMFTAAYKHTIKPGLLWYFDWAGTFNDRDAHFDLGAGGRGVTTDCHDAHGSPGGVGASPHCWAGGHLQGVSTGIKYNF